MESCPGKIKVPTDEEMEALAAMKSIKNRVREAKQRLNYLKAAENDANSKEMVELEGELASLKAEWINWEEKRQKAKKERMILLGHEEK
jgi:hypothetical protein